MLLQSLLLSLLVLQPSPAATTGLGSIVIINSSGGNNSECPGEEVAVPCRSLLKAFDLLQEFVGDTRVLIQTNLTLNDAVTVSNVSNFEIVGSNDLSPYNSTYVHCGTKGAGLIFHNVHNFSILNVALVNCMANFSDTYRIYKFAVMIESSSKFILKNVQFENCSTTALVLVNNTRQVTLDNTSFVQNHPKYRNSHLKMVSYPGAVSIQQNLKSSQEPVHFRIVGSMFHHNQSPETKVEATKFYSDFIDRGYGGALFIEFGGETSNSSLIIEDSRFLSNVAARGGAVYAYYKDDARNNSISIIHTNFAENNADISGGGLNLGCSSEPSAMNTFEVKHCRFINNKALFGTGLTIFSVYGSKKLSPTTITTFIIVNCTWWGNSGILSSAVDIKPLSNHVGEQGYLPVPQFINCTFDSNIIWKDNGLALGKTNHNNVGVFSVTQITVSFSGNTTFRNNSFSALLLESGIAEFEANSIIRFEKNTGFNGGAVAMYGFSTILFNINSDIKFLQNHAMNYGGAIFYQTSDQHSYLRGSNQCFLRNKLGPSEINLVGTIKVSFKNNSADVGGPAIYSESFCSCFIRCSEFMREAEPTVHYKFKYQNIFVCVGKFTYGNTGKVHPLISSANKFNLKGMYYSYSVFPGSSLSLPFTVSDDFHTMVKPLLSVTKLCPTSQIDVRDRYTLSNSIVPVGKPNSSSKFAITAISVREIYFLFEVTLLPCPPGYHIENNTCRCASGISGYKEIVKCDDSKFHAKYRGSYYVGYIPAESTDYKDLYFAPCVGPLCRGNNQHLPRTRANLTKLICAQHRLGIMCGECQDNYTTYYHSRSLTCGPIQCCHLGGLFYILSEIVPMVVLFTTVVTFDLSFTSGVSVGFIFFTQYLDRLTIHINPTFSYLRAPYRLFYGLFDFEFFHLEELSFCLWSNAQVLDILAVKYITMVIAFGMVLAFIAILRNNSCSMLSHLRRQVSAKTSVVHGLSAFLVTCYAQCTKTSFYILRYVEPSGYNGRRIGYYSYYGGLPYFTGHHLFYAIPALVSLVFVTILPPLVLLLYPLSLQLLSLCGLSEHWIVNRTLQLTGINKLKHFIDCFQSCYKDKLRFFAGLYFVYRAIILFAFMISANSLLFSVYSGIVILLWLGIHSAVQPYKKRLHNTIDSLVFFNLALINGCVIIAKVWVDLLDDPNLIASDTLMILLNIFQLLLLYAPMITVLAYLIWCGYAYIRNKSSIMGATSGFVEVENILEENSDHSHLTSSKGSDVSFRGSGGYGSMLDTY